MIDAVIIRTTTQGMRWALRLHGDVIAVSTEEWSTVEQAHTALDVVLEAIHWQRAR